ncbi:MAG: di-heme oxidoredictase family protein [Planctomycetota bacterium]
MNPRTLAWLAPLVLALPLAACGGGGGGGTPQQPPALGEPIHGLSTDELAAFQRGKALFERRFKPSEGLGPFYNTTSCRACHSTPASGGGAHLYRNFFLARFGDPTQPGQQLDFPTNVSAVVPAFGPTIPHTIATFSLEGGRHPIPATGPGGQPRQLAQRNGLAMFGVGLFEGVTQATLLSLADPNDVDQDGISGRMNTDLGSVGRFGVKAQSATIERFTRAPLMNQLGITSNPTGLDNLSVLQVSQDPSQPTIDHDAAPDPEIPPDELLDLIAFTRFLAPPAPKPFSAAALRGRTRFESLGCAKCHLPSIPSASGDLAAFTDLLLHDMGPDLADHIAAGAPQASTIDGPTTFHEFRTAPLWGVSHSGPWLHDGRAQTLEEAILAHGGEAQTARDDFAALPLIDRADVLAFLESL